MYVVIGAILFAIWFWKMAGGVHMSPWFHVLPVAAGLAFVMEICWRWIPTRRARNVPPTAQEQRESSRLLD